MPRALRTFLIALVSIGSLAGTIYLVGAETVLETLDSIRWPALAAAVVLVVLNTLLTLLRFRSVLGSFGFTPPLRNLFFAHSIGQVSNQILFNVIGQSLSRAAALTTVGVPFGVSVMATYWERIQAAILLFLLSLAGLWYVFLNIHFDMLPAGQYMLSLLASLLLCSLVVILTVLRSAGLLRNLPERLAKLIRLWPSLVLTLAAHISMLGAYICLLLGLGMERLDGGIVAAITIVMFTASLPISFAGWGIREFSAAQALGAVGVAEPVAVAAAVAIGLVSLALMLLMAGLGTILVLRRRPAKTVQPAETPPVGLDWGKIVLTACSLICAVLLFFQVRVPLEKSELTGNISDLIALTALGFAPYYLWTHRGARAVPRSLVMGLAGISAVLGLALIIGLLDFGWTGWAFVNRGVGWLIILGYIVTGLSVAMPGAEAHRRLVLGAIVATGSTLAVVQIVLLFATFGGLKIPRAVFNLPIQGYASSTNAFAVQMIVTIAAAVAAQHLGLFGRRRWLLPAILSVTGLTIYYCHSRAGLGMYAIALATMMIFPGALQRRSLLPAIIWPAITLLIGGVYLVPLLEFVASLAPAIGAGGLSDSQVFAIMQVDVAREHGDLERWTSVKEGWAMWLEHPIFGAGLGAYMYGYAQMGKSLIIHSTPIWLLAETGLVGCLVVVVAAIACLRHTYQGIVREADGWHIGLMIALVCFAAGNIVHDFFYQRTFWFLLGLCIAVTVRKDRSPA